MNKDSDPLLIAVDVGATGIKVVKAGIHGKKIEIEDMYSMPSVPKILDGHEYVDIDRILSALEEAILSELDNGRPVSAAIDTYGNGYGVIDADGELIHWPWFYRDARISGIMDSVNAIYTNQELYMETGNFPIKTRGLLHLYQDVLNQDENILFGERLLPLPNLLEYLLTGKIGAERTITSVLYMADRNGQDWNYPVIEKFGIPKKLFPKLAEPGRDCGMINRYFSREAIDRKVQLIDVIGHDTESALITGIDMDENSAFLCTGTSFIFGKRSGEILINADTYQNQFKNMRGAFGKYSFCKDSPGFLIQEKLLEEWRTEGGEVSYEELNQLAEQYQGESSMIDIGSDLFRISGMRITDAIRKYCEETGQPVPDSREAFAGCLYESYCFYIRRNIEILEDLFESKIERLFVFNGGIRNKMLMQMIADVIGRPVIAESRYASALGNLLMQYYVRNKCESPEELREPLQYLVQETHYNQRADRTEVWDLKYKRYKQVIHN